MEVQTRSEEGELRLWPTIAEAFVAAEIDSSIWKISWTNETTNERVRLVRREGLAPNGSPGGLRRTKNDVWVYEPLVLPMIPIESEEQKND